MAVRSPQEERVVSLCSNENSKERRIQFNPIVSCSECLVNVPGLRLYPTSFFFFSSNFIFKLSLWA